MGQGTKNKQVPSEGSCGQNLFQWNGINMSELCRDCKKCTSLCHLLEERVRERVSCESKAIAKLYKIAIVKVIVKQNALRWTWHQQKIWNRGLNMFCMIASRRCMWSKTDHDQSCKSRNLSTLWRNKQLVTNDMKAEAWMPNRIL